VNPDIVIARLMTFDRDNDGRLVKSELPERMQNLLAADVSGDQALDRDEIRAMARPAPPAQLPRRFRDSGTAGAAAIRSAIRSASQRVRMSRRAGRSTADADRASAGAGDRAALHGSPRSQRDGGADEGTGRPDVEAQLGRFKLMLDRQMSGHNMPAQIMTRPDGTRVNVFRLFGPDPAQVINSFALPPDQTKLALAAFEGFKDRLRPAGADREALLDELKNVLSDEERENFGAALQRRPLVKADAMFAGVVSGVMPPPPPLRALPGDVVSPSVILRQQVLEP
jgi:hypothetical protein